MNFNKTILALLMGIFLVAGSASASMQVSDSGVNNGQFHKFNFDAGCTVTANGGEAEIDCQAAAITSGTINGAVIGGVSPAAGTFTTLTSTGATSVGTTLGVTGDLTLSSAMIESTEDVTTSSADPGLGVAAITLGVTFVITDDTGAAADQVSLADGDAAGHQKKICLKTDNEAAGLAVIPANFKPGTQVLLEDAGDCVNLAFDGTDWYIVSNNGGTVS